MFHRILVGIDGSRRTEVIVNAAAGLALAAGASVHIVCAVDPAYFLEEANGVRPSSTDELDYPAAANEREGGDNLVRKVVAELVNKGLEASGMVVGGEPVQATLTAAFQLTA
jgi:nucleotide-binding universal stress UspA family protein